MTVLTGETGAGKSIIIDAVNLLTGGRGSTQFIKHGKERAEIIGQFHLTSNKQKISDLCAIYDISLDDETIILERILNKSGKTVCRINNKIVSLTVLREFGEIIVQIHSQHDTMHLLDNEQHLSLVDHYNKENIEPLKEEYRLHYNELLQLKQKYNELYTNEQEMAHRLDLLQFQLTELDQANLVEDEDEELEVERKQLQNFEQIYNSLQEAHFALHGDAKGLELLHIANQALEKGQAHDHFIAKQNESLTNLYYQLEDISLQIDDYKDSLHFDEARLNEIESRLNELSRLQKKYGNSVAEMIQYKEKIAIELDEITNRDDHLEKLLMQINDKEEKALKVAKQLHQVRVATAGQLEKDLHLELKDLYLENARFSVQFASTREEKLSKDGLDDVSFMLSTNVGEPLKELDKVASGGELSRIMLALKKLLAEHDLIQTVIFDEIDAGVSGRVAQAIAEKMYQISNNTQTLCITHLPQVAAMADHHLLIEKQINKERTSTKITRLKHDAVINELGKMMTGTKLTDSALDHAQELLDLTNKFKKSVSSKFSAS